MMYNVTNKPPTISPSAKLSCVDLIQVLLPYLCLANKNKTVTKGDTPYSMITKANGVESDGRLGRVVV